MLLMKLQQDSAAAKKKAAAIAALRRICTPKGKSGHLEVSKDIQARFQKRGAARDELLDVYMECGCDKAGLHWNNPGALVGRHEDARSANLGGKFTLRFCVP